MTVGSALRELGRVLDEFERETAVRSVGLVEPTHSGGERALTADVQLTLSANPAAETDAAAVSLDATSVESGGRLRLAFESTESLVPATDRDVTVEAADATVVDGGDVSVVLSVTVRTGDEAAGEKRIDATRPTEVAGSKDGADISTAADRGRELPPFRDPELLSEVYNSCGTFAEMAAELDMDVTAETVRRYMIDYDIHQPDSYDTDGEDTTERDDSKGEIARDPEGELEGDSEGERARDPDESPVVLADGVGLPNEVTVERLVESVESSNTVYEVERKIGVDREEALDLLRELDLLDLVVGRLATEAERDISREEVIDRLRETSAT